MSIHQNNMRKKKWLFYCSYNPNKNNISKHLHCLSKGLDAYISQYHNLVLLEKFESNIERFLQYLKFI